MKVDIGFWNEQGEYIPDIQEVSEVEMDKEIIIDGVNVAGCEQRFGDDKCALLDQYFCENNPDCYYKQLKRLEQENARLKNERTADLVRQIDLWKENFEGQRNAYEKLNSMYKENCEYTNKLEQTLQEIKAIVGAPKPFIDFSATKTATEVGYDYAAICNELELRLHKVLELITKVEEK